MLVENEGFAPYRAGLSPEFMARVQERRRREAIEAQIAAEEARREAALAAEEAQRESDRAETLRIFVEEAERALDSGRAIRKSIALIVAETAVKHRVTVKEILGPKRTKPIVRARHEAFYRARIERPDMSYPELGMAFGGKDHTTILHAVKKMERLGVPA